jgi:hypothetical protein
MGKKFRYNYWSNNLTLSETSKLRHKLHQLIYNNVNKIHKFDKEMFEQLKQMILSNDINDRKIALGLVTNGKFTPKQATYLVYNCSEMMSPEYTTAHDEDIIPIVYSYQFNKSSSIK